MLLKVKFYRLFRICIEKGIENMRCLAIYLFLFIKNRTEKFLLKRRRKNFNNSKNLSN
jgi:hypothetical protein